MKGSYVFLADGFEEIEALATVDILRRAGIDAETVSIDEEGFVSGAHGITVTVDRIWPELLADLRLEDTEKEDLMVFPGGMPGAKNLSEQPDLMAIAQRHFDEGGTIAAICAAPGVVVSKLNGVAGRKATCYMVYEKAPAVTDGNLITGRGPGCAVDFALAIVESVCGKEKADALRAGMMI